MKKLLLFSALITLLAGCKKDEPYPKADYFYGKWIALPNLVFEFANDGTIKTTYKNQGPASQRVDVVGKGTWSYDEKSKNLKLFIKSWNDAGLYFPLPGSLSTLDAIVDQVTTNSFTLYLSDGTQKFEKMP